MRKAIGYCRVSTNGQEDKFGLEAQKEEISKYAEANGYEIVEWFTDVISGVKESRPQFDRIVLGTEVSNPPYEAVIVYKSDRVAREIKLYFYFEFLLEKRGVKLVSVNDGFPDVDEAYKNVIKSFVLFSAEQERRNISLRTSKGREIKASSGGYAGGGAPYGYKAENGELVVVPEEANIVRMIFAMYKTEGKSQLLIAKTLRGRGYKTKTGKDWYNVQVGNILRYERFYKGEYRYGKDGEWVKGKHQPILD